MPPTTHTSRPLSGPLDLDLLRARLSGRCSEWQVESIAETGSTNADLMRRFSDQSQDARTRLRQLPNALSWSEACAAFPPCARVAGVQTAGRGRLGRPWRSASGKSLLFSLGIVMPRPVGALSGLSLAIGLGVIDGLRALPLSEAARLGLKWPNDILLDDAKLGGILIETSASTAHACALVIGIGLNIDAPPASPSATEQEETKGAGGTDGGERHGGGGGGGGSDSGGSSSGSGVSSTAASSAVATALPPAHLAMLLPTALRDAPRDALLTEVFAAILPAVSAVLARFATEGLAPFSARWWEMHRFAQRSVSIIDNGETKLSGTAVGIDQYGRLIIDTAHGNAPSALVTVTAGDVSLRLTNAMVGANDA